MRFQTTALLLATANLARAGTQLKAWYGSDCDRRFGTLCTYNNTDSTKDFDICCGVGNYKWQSFELVTDTHPDATVTAYTGDGACKTGPNVSVGVGECGNVDVSAPGWSGGGKQLFLLDF
jgi:hypothetical protein